MSDDPERERDAWRNFPRRRPARIVKPGPGQESVWEYPRPPRMEPVADRIRVELHGATIADSRRAVRVLETSSPPVYYVPPEDVRMEHLLPAEGSTSCEWKGVARYWTVRVGDRVAERAAWSYPDPEPDYRGLRGYVAFYPTKMDGCFVGDRRASPQAGTFYGGWITPDIVGPFKGGTGTDDW